ncbi:MAG: UDP-4-amino-4-deoxy-L-arabinose-oxoglutarate aminotransferase [Betaproteobacteria bacterium RIFCSPLOWO2_02_FULL_66_14]|nr:MAG: UDP-4-amino-4-deoxy-L-arabinose-oxoglutarate aminotransferase [Betaproteobacteria bacterium RIFCSPLOWO2_02_FULL_66_14]
MSAIELSVVIPVFDEEAGLPALFERLYPALDSLGLRYEVIFVDDGSRDRSAQVLREQFARRADVTRVVLLAANFGQHMAILAAFERSRGGTVVTLDADLQNPPEEIGKLLEAIRAGHDYVGSYRHEREDSAFRRIASRMINSLRERTTDIRMTDHGCMLRAYARGVVDAINQSRETNAFVPALAYTFARRPTEIEVAHAPRAAGESKYSLYRLIQLNFDLMTGFSAKPLQIYSLFGMLVSVGSIATYVIVLGKRLLEGDSFGRAIAVIWDRDILQFLLIGVTLFGIGLLGEYVSRIIEQVRGRPRYLVRAVIERDPPA